MKWTFEVFGDDGVTVRAEFGTDPAHANPYLDAPTELAASEVDLAEGKAPIGTCNVVLGDKRSVAADQASGRVTALLATQGGESAVNGRRGRLRQIETDGSVLTVLDGVISGVTLNPDFVSYTVALKDENERARKKVSPTGTATVFPRGVLNGYGKRPDGGWLVAPTAPVKGTFNTSGGGRGSVSLDVDGFPAHLVLTSAMERATAGMWSKERRVEIMPDVKVGWRLVGQTGWNWLTDLRPVRWTRLQEFAFQGTSIPRGLFLSEADTFTRKVEGKKEKFEARRITGLVLWPATAQTLPANNVKVEVVVVYVGAPSADYPWHFEGQAWELAQTLYDLVGARYKLSALQTALSVPCRGVLTKPIEGKNGVWEFLGKELYRPTGAAPAVDSDGEIAPVRYQLPAADVTLPEINNAIAEPLPGWEHPDDKAVNLVRFFYPREYAVPAEVDPLGESSRGDGMAEVTQEIEVRPPDALSTELLGERDLEIKSSFFRAIAGKVGEPVTGDVLSETGALLAYERGKQALDRFLFGAQTAVANCRRSATKGLRPGDWVILAVSWMPNYQTGKRGINALAQVVSIKDLSPIHREIHFVTAGPNEQPVTQPALGALSVDTDGVISINISSVPDGGEALVEFAASATEPPAASALWIPAGRLSAPGSLATPAQAAGATVWVRARGVKVGRRPSAWTNAISVAVPQTPRILSASVEIGEDGTPTVRWEVNVFAAGARVYFAAHLPTVTPTLTTYVDSAGSAGSVTLPLTVLAGQALTVEVEPWSGWTGSAVSGTAGVRVPAAGGRGEDETTYGILKARRIAETDTSETWEILTGAGVDEVAIYTQPVERPYLGGTDPKETGDFAAQLVVSGGRVEYTFQKPSAKYELLASLVPLDAGLDQRARSKEILISPVPPLVSGEIKVEVVNAVAHLTPSVWGTLSAFPVTIAVYEGSTLNPPLLSWYTFAEPGSLAGHPALQNRPLPLSEVQSWFLIITDVAGNETPGTPATADRDPLARLWPTVVSRRPLPYIDMTYDDDTDDVRLTLSDGRTWTKGGLSGSGILRYTLGDLLDNGTAEAALAPEEVRGPYTLEARGGGEWRTFWDGVFEGPPAIQLVTRWNQTATDAVGTLQVIDPFNLRTGVYAKTHGGGGAVNLSDPEDGTWTLLPTAPYAASIPLPPLHNPVIAFAVRYAGTGSVNQYVIREHTFDVDVIARIDNISPTFDAVGRVVVSSGGDEDTVRQYVKVGIDADPADPTAASNHGVIQGDTGVVNTGVSCGIGREARVKVVGENLNGELGRVKTATLRRGDHVRAETEAVKDATTVTVTARAYNGDTPSGTLEYRDEGGVWATLEGTDVDLVADPEETFVRNRPAAGSSPTFVEVRALVNGLYSNPVRVEIPAQEGTAPGEPKLIGATAYRSSAGACVSGSGGGVANALRHQVEWTVEDGAAGYVIRVEYATDFAAYATLNTYSGYSGSAWWEPHGVVVHYAGGPVHKRVRYRVLLIRQSDSAVLNTIFAGDVEDETYTCNGAL